MEVLKAIQVGVPPERAFKAFTEDIGRWWPLHEGYSFGGDRADSVFIEPQVGGRFYERFKDGDEFVVGIVSAYEPPHRLVFSWKAPQWDGLTEIEVRFEAQAGGTLVSVAHRSWEKARVALPERDGYDGGWVTVLARYTAFANA